MDYVNLLAGSFTGRVFRREHLPLVGRPWGFNAGRCRRTTAARRGGSTEMIMNLNGCDAYLKRARGWNYGWFMIGPQMGVCCQSYRFFSRGRRNVPHVLDFRTALMG